MGFVFLAVLAAMLIARVDAAGKARPNVVVILADDLGRADYSGFGTADIRTPHIDSIGREGLTFENFRANSPVCSPSRAALLTGCYPDRVGVPGVIREDAQSSWGKLSRDAVLLPEVLKRGGYHSAIVGKWHLGTVSEDTPNARGFDFFHGFLGDMMDDYWTHLRYGKNWMRRNGDVVEEKEHATELFTRWAVEYLESRAGVREPFFLYLAYNAPHDPIQPPEDWLKRVKEREPGISEKRAKLVALIEHMDDGVGRVLGALDRLKLSDNTLVLFTSDNGGKLLHGANNGPWREGKEHVYDGGLRVPAMVRWPAAIAKGRRSGINAVTMDIFATVCEAAGAKAPSEIDGRSFLSEMTGKIAGGAPERELYFVRREGGPTYGGKTIEALISGQWKLLQDSPYAPLELYDMRADPEEKSNVIGKESKVARELGKRLQWHVQRGGHVPWQPREGVEEHSAESPRRD